MNIHEKIGMDQVCLKVPVWVVWSIRIRVVVPGRGSIQHISQNKRGG